jgi:hypothetical protein
MKEKRKRNRKQLCGCLSHFSFLTLLIYFLRVNVYVPDQIPNEGPHSIPMNPLITRMNGEILVEWD